MKILWLASWYPDEFEPTNGDFIQRHAKAVSTIMPVDLIHVVQAGKDFDCTDKTVLNNNGNLHESICYFHFKKTGIAWYDKVSYNRTYMHFYKNIIHQYIQEKGRPDLIHVHVPMKAGIIAVEIYKQLNIRYIVSEHSSLYLKIADDNFSKRSFYFRYNTKRVFKHAALVTNVSAAIGKVLQQVFRLDNVLIIPNVVDTNHFNNRHKQSNKIFRWLHVSTMLPLKNVDKIIKAFKNVLPANNKWEFIICGPINKEYEKLVEQLQLQSKIKFIGEISYEQVAVEMQKSDAFIMFSKHENFPCVVIEALCCGLPVIASNVGGIAEAVNETNGILVEPHDIKALEKAILSAMNDRSQFNLQLISENATSKYNYKVVANQFITAYNKALMRV